MEVLVENAPVTNVLSLGGAADSLRVVNMGGGVLVVDQVDPDTQKAQRIVLVREDVAAILRAGSASTFGNLNQMVLGHNADAVRVVNMGSGVVVIDQVDPDTRGKQRVVLTKTDLAAMLIWLS
jgi:hypothetical protein